MLKNKVDFEVVFVYNNKQGTGEPHIKKYGGDMSCENMGCVIHTVKRLSDGEVFSVGDETTQDEISRFQVSNEGVMYVHYTGGGFGYLATIKKAVQLEDQEDKKHVGKRMTRQTVVDVIADNVSCRDGGKVSVRPGPIIDAIELYSTTQKQDLLWKLIEEWQHCTDIGESDKQQYSANDVISDLSEHLSKLKPCHTKKT